MNDDFDLLLIACGDLGAGVAELALAAGWRVAALRRDISQLPAGVHGIAVDLQDAEAIAGLGELKARYHLYTLTPFGRGPAAYEAAFSRAFPALLASLPAPKRALFVSSTSVYGQSEGEWIDESSRAEPRADNGRMILAAEQALAAMDYSSSVIRFGGIYGRGEGMLLNKVREGRCDDPALPRFTNRIHRSDCVAALWHLLQLEALEPVYLGVDSSPATNAEVQQWLAAELGVDYAFVPGQEPRAGSKRCSNARLLASGLSLQYPDYRAGYHAALS